MEDLKSTLKPWKIVMMHEPAYCSGGHDENKELMALSKSVFEPNGVDFVLAGHSHFYQRNEVNGITHLVMGSAGAPLYQPKMTTYTKFQAKEHHFAIIDVSSFRIKIFIYNEKNELLEMVEKWQ
jgi:predicted phosphodiesterase